MKIKIAPDSQKLEDYEIKKFKDFGADKLAYFYEYESWEGTGFAIYSVGKKIFYLEMSHCSCNGPTDFFDHSHKMPVTKTELKKICDNKDYNKAKLVLAAFNKIK